MIFRSLIATAVLLTTLSSVAMQTAAPTRDPRPQIDWFTGPGPNGGPCPPCDAADRAFKTDAALWRAIEGRYRIGQKWDYRKAADQATFEKYNINSWPTFLITQQGRELGRVEGFRGSQDLWAGFKQIRSQPPQQQRRTEPPVSRRQPESQPLPNELERQLRDAAAQMREDRDALESQLRILQRDLAKERQRADAITNRANATNDAERAKIEEAARQAEQRIEDKLQELRQEQQRLEDYERRRARSDPVRDPFRLPPVDPASTGGSTPASDCEDGICELPANPPSKPTELPDKSHELPGKSPEQTEAKTSGGWASVGRWVAGTAIAIVAPQVAIPTGLGIGLTVAGWLWKRRQHRKQQPSQTLPTQPTQPTQQPNPQPTATEGDRPQGDGFPDPQQQPPGRRVSAAESGPAALPRDNTEIEQILSLRQQEQREPVHDAFFGVLFEDEYRSDPDQSIRDAYTRAMERFNGVAPLSSRATSASTTTTKTGT